MAQVTYEKEVTALLVIDPYNDFISEGGKFWDHMRHVAEANNCVPNMLQVLNAARKAELRVFYIGLIAHTCVEATVRFAAELGYEVTMVKDAPRITRMKRCTPLSTSISQTTPLPW